MDQTPVDILKQLVELVKACMPVSMKKMPFVDALDSRSTGTC